jgi:uncharacterized protein with HEPN domain
LTVQAERDFEHLDLIVRLIDHIQRRLSGCDWNRFLGDEDEIDLTSFRLLHIGEASHKLSHDVKVLHPEIEWPKIYRMRNILSHDYSGSDPMMIWESATERLETLRAACVTELARL